MIVSIIVVSYNTSQYTVECIKSIISETRKYEYEVLVYDNASSDDSVEKIKELKDKRVILLESNENYGFAKANNICSQLAKGEYLLLLNPDTVVLSNAIDNLIDLSVMYPDSGIWGGKTVFPDKTLNRASCWTRQTLWSLFSQAIGLSSIFKKITFFNPEGIGGWDRNGRRNVDIVSGCFLLIKKKSWVTLGGFREMFFMYGEEADLCLRAKEKGLNPMVCSSATIIHYGGASEKVRADKLVRLLKAKMLLVREHFSPIKKLVAYELLSLWPLSRYMIHSFFSLLGRKSSLTSRDSWNEVCRRKKEWIIR